MRKYSKKVKDKLKAALDKYEAEYKKVNKGTARPNGSTQSN